jgi:hypothetical protein
MKTKFKFFKGLLLIVLSIVSVEMWAQTSQTLTQTVCPGTEPYEVTPGDVSDTFLWSISSGVDGVDWVITNPTLDSTSVIWANTLIPVIYHLSLTESNADGCDKVVSVDVTVNPKPATTVSTLTQPTCGVSTGTITVTSPVAGAGISYTVTGTNPIVAGVSNTTGIFAGLTSGDYDITTTNSYSCTSVPENVTINAQPITPSAPVASLTQPTCGVATGTITVTSPATGAGISYTVTGTSPVVAGVTNTTGIFSGLAPGAYDITTTNAEPCTSLATNVTINAQPITPSAPIASLTQPTCGLGTGTITVTTPSPAVGISYTVTGTSPVVGAITNTTGIFSGLAPGDYDVTTTNAVLCTSLATSVTINAQPVTPTAPVVSLTQPTCSLATGTATVTSPIAGAGISYTITGTNPVVASVTNTTGIFSGLATGDYDVTTTNAEPCTSLATSIVIIIQPATPTTSPIWHN